MFAPLYRTLVPTWPAHQHRWLANLCGLLLLFSVLGLAVSLLGQLLPLASLLAMAWSVLAGPMAILCVAMAVIGFRSRGFVARMSLAAVISAIAVFNGTEVTFGTPLWVKLRAAPLIEAVVEQAGGGPFPTEDQLPPALRDQFHSSDCFYLRRDNSFEITCQGVVFTNCTYNHSTGRWSGWN